jgi:hypothetical protein
MPLALSSRVVHDVTDHKNRDGVAGPTSARPIDDHVIRQASKHANMLSRVISPISFMHAPFLKVSGVVVRLST